MSTAAQIAANQKNATRSTGPRTPKGKKVSSANATRHGLAGAFRVMPGEDPEEYLDLLESYQDQFQPATDHEDYLVTLLAQSRWKMQRIERLQAEALDQILESGDPEQSPDAAVVTALGKPGSAFDRLQRYSAQYERTYFRASRELAEIARQRVKDRRTAVNGQIDRIMNGPLPNGAPKNACQSALRNEPNPAPASPCAASSAACRGPENAPAGPLPVALS